MTKAKPYTDKDGEVRELDEGFFKSATRGRPAIPAANRKKRVNVMLDPEVAQALKEAGDNVSAKVNALLRRDLGLDA